MNESVRMRGFRSRSTVQEATAWVDGVTQEPCESERVPLHAAASRVTATEVRATVAVPRFVRAAMDGYAVVADDTFGARPADPVILRVTGRSMPGRPSDVAVTPGTAIRIMTGAPVPPGATAVVPVELTRPSTSDRDAIEVTEPVATQRHIGRIGEDIAAGAVTCAKGQTLLPQHLGVLASTGVTTVEVVRQPGVRIVVTGPEVVAAGQPAGEYQVFDANSPMLAALVHRDGGRVEQIIRLSDDRDAIESALVASGCDVILVSGGSSVGEEDFAPELVAARGELAIHGIAMRPSSPAGLGRIGRTLICLLPGNPVSCLCAYDFFGGRAIRRLGGRDGQWPYRQVQGQLTRRIVSAVGRTDYCRVRLTDEGVEPLAISGASILSSTTRADGFIVVSEGHEGYAVRDTVNVWLY